VSAPEAVHSWALPGGTDRLPQRQRGSRRPHRGRGRGPRRLSLRSAQEGLYRL